MTLFLASHFFKPPLLLVTRASSNVEADIFLLRSFFFFFCSEAMTFDLISLTNTVWPGIFFRWMETINFYFTHVLYFLSSLGLCYVWICGPCHKRGVWKLLSLLDAWREHLHQVWILSGSSWYIFYSFRDQTYLWFAEASKIVSELKLIYTCYK